MTIDRLCFGTSTFVRGLLRPDKDSGPGIETLREAIRRGLRCIHSNPRLRTQWAVRRALEGAPAVRHHIKADVPFDPPHAPPILSAINASRKALDLDTVDALVIEIDLKRTIDVRYLGESRLIAEFFSACASIALGTGNVREVYAYCHTPREMRAAMGSAALSGFAAQFNLAVPWAALFFDEIDAPFLGMSPLARAALCGPDLMAVRWAAADPRVMPVVTMSSVAHLDQMQAAVSDPLPVAEVQVVVDRWLSIAQAQQ